ncbi:hypothetical protein ASD45_05515 [Pseudolabrys sp. Root1462]|uniref:DUF2336 domain-containing protein n=1 Tax=Pseudolabrys sp. Root1462 TaxID=1736466 RepID=UPI00070331CE|nr:DUF2336 domain-containing protein [Pseudolabrys sp. Root1462]KQZ00375.1 hypothetical protein ASD45_05515 [Pseudolabrys sp. Root1462]
MSAKAAPEKSLSILAEDLASLAAERAPDKRVELLRRIALAYATYAEPTLTAELYLFNEVVSKLIDKLSGADRAAASASLAGMVRLPVQIVRRLATDADIDVARPMIRDYKAVPEGVLVDVARTGSQDHLRAIAGRDEVTPPVTEVVAERGDASVVRILAGNNGARFSDAGMRRMIARAGNDVDLQALLVDRKDLSLAAVERLLPIVTEELARRLCERTPTLNEAAVLPHLAEWLADRSRNAEQTRAYAAGLRNGDLRPCDVFCELFAQGRLYDASAVLASLLNLGCDYTFGVLAGSSLQSALLLMRAATLPWVVVDCFLKMRQTKTELHRYGSTPTRVDYLALDAGAAQRVVRFAKVRQSAGAALV